ncbi:hypothetical protein [Maribacter stanieri]|uniref:hypothetical protein n=1 Tax=Maribacter stanieri TaxID=440514 RepID=UPI0024949E43|nr:hypothetical protein [Maribacter stanieri]
MTTETRNELIITISIIVNRSYSYFNYLKDTKFNFMYQKEIRKEKISECFTPELTIQFQIEMDAALKKIDITPVKAVLDKYSIANFQDSIDFVETLDYCLNGWKKENMDSKVYSEVTTSDSKCIACEHGKCNRCFFLIVEYTF